MRGFASDGGRCLGSESMTGAGERVPRDAVRLRLPLAGPSRVENSPARRVPSHGTDLLGTRYAIDFTPVDERGRSGLVRDWRTVLATEPPERYVGFGRPVLAPCDGIVAAVHDGEEDHAGRRSPVALVPYALGQAAGLRGGWRAVAGNAVTIRGVDGAFVAVCHLRRGSLRVRVGDAVRAGQALAECGNSGNSTQPHVHVQAMDAVDPTMARGVPITFLDVLERRRPGADPERRAVGVPREGSLVEPAG